MKRSWLIGAALVFSLATVGCKDDDDDDDGVTQRDGGADAGRVDGGANDGGMDAGKDASTDGGKADAGDAN